MKSMPLRRASALCSAALLLFGTEAQAQWLETQQAQATQADIQALRAELDQRIRELDALKHKLADEEANFDRLSHEIETGKLDTVRGTGSTDVNGQPVGNASVSTGGSGTNNATISTGGATAAAQVVAADQVAQNSAPGGGQNGGQEPVGPDILSEHCAWIIAAFLAQISGPPYSRNITNSALTTEYVGNASNM
jgi:hypothetical protein